MALELKDIGYIIGSISGVTSLIVLTWTRFSRWVNQPKLKIGFDKKEDLRVYNFVDTGWERKFFTLHIRNSGKYTAKRCVAVAKPITFPTNVGHLESEYTLHWAGVNYSAQTTGAEPVDIGSERRRLDIAFADKGSEGGAWLSMPLALSLPGSTGQAYLPPGEYQIEIRVSCENGRGDCKRFKLTSPQIWTDLDAEEI